MESWGKATSVDTVSDFLFLGYSDAVYGAFAL